MNLQAVENQLEKARNSAFDLLRETKTLFDKEISSKYALLVNCFLPYFVVKRELQAATHGFQHILP
jgi:hypothetical protein